MEGYLATPEAQGTSGVGDTSLPQPLRTEEPPRPGGRGRRGRRDHSSVPVAVPGNLADGCSVVPAWSEGLTRLQSA